MHMDNIPWNATAFQLSCQDNAVRRATAVIFQDGRIIGNIADGVLRSPTKTNQIAYHEKFLKQHLQFAGAACRVVLVQHARAYEDAMSFSVKHAWARWGARNVLATFDEMPKPATREHEFTKKGQGLLFAFKQDDAPNIDAGGANHGADSMHRGNCRQWLARYGILY